MKLFLDTETYCETPLKNGTHVYAEKAEVMVVTYAVDDSPVGTWDRTAGEPMPDDLDFAIDEADE